MTDTSTAMGSLFSRSHNTRRRHWYVCSKGWMSGIVELLTTRRKSRITAVESGKRCRIKTTGARRRAHVSAWKQYRMAASCASMHDMVQIACKGKFERRLCTRDTASLSLASTKPCTTWYLVLVASGAMLAKFESARINE